MNQRVMHRRAQIVNAVYETLKPLQVERYEDSTDDHKAGDRIPKDDAPEGTKPDPNPADPEHYKPATVNDPPLTVEGEELRLFEFQTVQKQFTHWTSLVEQGAVPALMMLPGDGDNSEAPAVGYVDEEYPIMLTVVLVDKPDYPLIDQASDAHYAIERKINACRDLGVDGVDPTQTQLGSRRVSGPALYPAFLIEFQLMIVHEYRATESV